MIRKLLLPLIVALACVGAGLSSLPASAASSKSSKHAAAKPKPLRIDSLAVGTKAGPLAVRVAAGIHSQVGMTVNGHRVKHPFEATSKESQQIELSSTDSLRAGPNKLRIRARHAGVERTATRTVRVPGWALAADAGEDADTMVHVHARVGTVQPPGAKGSGGDLRYGWRIVERPRGAKATLAGRGEAQPVLRATKPGSYVLQLKAEPEEGDEPASFDQVTVSVVPNDPPIGVPINTIADGGAISIAGQSYGGGEGLAYVVLERTTRNVVASGNVLSDAAGTAKLAELANQYGAIGNFGRYMMIVSGRSGILKSQLGAFAAVLKKLGVALPSAENFLALEVGLPFSVIGYPGAPAGAATIRVPGGGYTPPISGAITGYLQKNPAVEYEGTTLYEYVSPEQPAFDTKAPGSTESANTMKIGDQTYTASLPAGADAGLHLVVLESLSLGQLTNVVLGTNVNNNLQASQAMQAVTAKELNIDIEKPGGPIVFLQTVGKPHGAGPQWEGVVRAMIKLGANPQLINALDGTTEYAFVGRLGAEGPPAEASTAADKGPYGPANYPPARLVGTLARSRTSNFVPNVVSTPTTANPEGSVNIALMSLAYQAPQAWPELAPDATREEAGAAQNYICEELNFCQATNSCPTMRECFWQKYNSDWTIKYTTLNAVAYPTTDRGFKLATFETVKKELLTETKEVATVKSYLKGLQEPFENSSLGSYVDLQNIGQNVWQSVQQPQVKDSAASALGLVSKIVALGSLAPPPAGNAAKGISAAFGLASYLSTKGGQPILGSEIRARSAELGGELVERISLARKTMTSLGMLLVSDYGKLSTAYQHIDSDWSLPEPSVAAQILRTSAKQWFYEALIPTAYPYLIRANNANNARNLSCDRGNHFGWFNQPDIFQMNTTIGYDSSGNPINGVFFFTRGIGGASSPPQSLGDEMFRHRDAPNPGLGIEKLQFFTSRVFGGKIARAVNNATACDLGWLPGQY
jgi:hypothetical protein